VRAQAVETVFQQPARRHTVEVRSDKGKSRADTVRIVAAAYDHCAEIIALMAAMVAPDSAQRGGKPLHVHFKINAPIALTTTSCPQRCVPLIKMSATDQIGHVAVRICQKVFDEVSNRRVMKEDQNVVAESSGADEVAGKLLQRVLPITTAR